jgi:hypothetical protein
MYPTIVQVDAESERAAFLSLQKDFRQQRTHDTKKKVLGVEMPPGGIKSTT